MPPAYPSAEEIDIWCESRLAEADKNVFRVDQVFSPQYSFRLGIRHTADNTYLKFSPGHCCPFYAYWQPVPGGGPAPLLIHLPGYGAELSAHPELVHEGFNVLHINPLGYGTPTGPDESKKENGNWPVLEKTVESAGKSGYRYWLRDALIAIRWACSLPIVNQNRLALFGTSQGGGAALLLASILKDRGVKAVAADVPFLTDFAGMFEAEHKGAYQRAYDTMERIKAETPEKVDDCWKAIGQIDTLCHAERLAMPVLLTAGDEDEVTPLCTAKKLFDALPGTRSFTELSGQGHAYTVPFLYLTKAWFRIYV